MYMGFRMTLSVALILAGLSFNQLALSAVIKPLTLPLHSTADQPIAAAADISATKIVSGIDRTSVEPGSGVAVIKEPVPLGAYAVFDHHGHICILITLTVEFQIIYFNEYGERKKASLPLPNNASVSGSCARDGEKPKIIFSWGSFRFAILFRQNEFGNTWFVSDMRLFYDLNDRLFIESKSGSGMQSARMDVEAQHVLKLFASPVDKAYFCTSEQDLELLDATGTQTATILLRDVHIQPYVNNGQFGPSVNCPGGKVGRRKINETVPLAVGSTLACVTIATIAGYALWRYVKVKKFVYGTME